MIGAAGTSTSTAIRCVSSNIYFAPVSLLIAVAIGKTRIAGTITYTATTAYCNISGAANSPTPAAIVNIGSNIYFASVGLLIAVTISKTCVAGTATYTAGAGTCDIIVAANCTATTAIINIAGYTYLASVGLFIAVTISKACSAGTGAA